VVLLLRRVDAPNVCPKDGKSLDSRGERERHRGRRFIRKRSREGWGNCGFRSHVSVGVPLWRAARF